jgi:hypothetical protein
MDQLFHVIGLALPDTPVIFRLKVLFGGICGLAAGMLVMISGLEGSVLWGDLTAACGAALIGLTIRSHVREARNQALARMALQRRQEEEAREHRERLVRQESCDHSWIQEDAALNYDVYQKFCTKCGAVQAGCC